MYRSAPEEEEEGWVGVWGERADLPLRSSLPAEVVRYKKRGDLYDNKYDDVDGRERHGFGGGEVGDYRYYENKGGEDALGVGGGGGGEEEGSGGNFWVNPRGRLDEPGDGGEGMKRSSEEQGPAVVVVFQNGGTG